MSQMELCQCHNEWAVSITFMLLGKEWRPHRLELQSSLSIWDEERVGLLKAKRRPQGQIKSTCTGYHVLILVSFSLKVSATLSLWYQSCIYKISQASMVENAQTFCLKVSGLTLPLI